MKTATDMVVARSLSKKPAFIQAVLLISVFEQRLNFRMLQNAGGDLWCCKLRNGFMAEPCWGFRG